MRRSKIQPSVIIQEYPTGWCIERERYGASVAYLAYRLGEDGKAKQIKRSYSKREAVAYVEAQQ